MWMAALRLKVPREYYADSDTILHADTLGQNSWLQTSIPKVTAPKRQELTCRRAEGIRRRIKQKHAQHIRGRSIDGIN